MSENIFSGLSIADRIRDLLFTDENIEEIPAEHQSEKTDSSEIVIHCFMPHNSDDITKMMHKLPDDLATVIYLNNLPDTEKQRLTDYLMGYLYVKDGEMLCLTDNILFLYSKSVSFILKDN